MGLLDQVNIDIQQITSNANEFGSEILMTSPNGQIANIVGLHAKIHLGVSTEGNPINSKQGRITFSEQVLTNANPAYPLRNASGDVDLTNHVFEVKDSTGIVKKYRSQSWMPDETIGLILVMLADSE